MRRILSLIFFVCASLLLMAVSNSTFAQTLTPTPAPPTSSIPIGQYGCSVKNDSQRTIVIACQNGGFCNTQVPEASFNPATNTYEHGYCMDIQNKCPVCDTGYQPNYKTGKCDSINDPQAAPKDATPVACANDQGCNPGYGCSGGSTNNQAPPLSLCQNNTCKTALGPLPTSIQGLLTSLFSIVLSIAGVAVLILIIISGYRLMLSQGNPEQIKDAREQLTAAIVGLLFIIFSLVILQVIGVNILKIPGFAP